MQKNVSAGIGWYLQCSLVGNVNQTPTPMLWFCGNLMEHKIPFGDVSNGLVAAMKAKEGERPPVESH